MEKKLYYIELECIKDCKFPNVEYHKGDILYFNPNASSNETYIYNYENRELENVCKLVIYDYKIIGKNSHIPFVRLKNRAKKWQIKGRADWYADYINNKGHFKATVKEIKITYTEEEV